MTIEVRQMVIKSSVLQRIGEEGADEENGLNVEALKEDIRAECRRLFQEWVREQQER
jgi:hypothetical protein